MNIKLPAKQCIPGILALLLLGGCGNPSSGGASSTSITITNAPSGNFYSLTVFEETATIGYSESSITKLTGYKAQGIGAGDSSSFTIRVSPEIPAGDYVLVLGVSTNISTGKMYITGSSGSRQPISVAPGGTITYNSSVFLDNGGVGYEALEIVGNFGSPSSP
ncbi:MAG: hypothetical protein LBP60_05095 [Spirochaetaceae bacterium]|jgi:hypothetical protein|nr:hypothetical protein [Spirochaetaceae bacterium]